MSLGKPDRDHRVRPTETGVVPSKPRLDDYRDVGVIRDLQMLRFPGVELDRPEKYVDLASCAKVTRKVAFTKPRSP